MVALAEVLTVVVGVYVAAGVLFAVPFVLRGVNRIDPVAQGGTWGFRLIIVPGVVALWPLLALRWLRGAQPPEERNAHRATAKRGLR
jgi:uncharacterized membrane protein YdfJ with MMPL/SSD domain